MRKSPRQSKTRKDALKAGFRSGLELEVSKILDKKGIKWEYETVKLKYTQKVTHKKMECGRCGHNEILQFREYLPDFILKETGMFLEVKGRFTMADRKKILSVLENNPNINLMMVFQDSSIKISKKSKKSYGDWCDSKNINWQDYKKL